LSKKKARSLEQLRQQRDCQVIHADRCVLEKNDSPKTNKKRTPRSVYATLQRTTVLPKVSQGGLPSLGKQ
jgi:hypothetical protein